jgi:hypothetical protein
MNTDNKMMPERSDRNRFLDEGLRLDDFRDEFLVVCPKCRGMARVIPAETGPGNLNVQLFSPRKLVCLGCVHRETWTGKQILTGSNVDWYFRLPLWLQVSCCGELLWAYNFAHLDIIEQYVSAKLRERTKKGRNSFLSKMPAWLKLAKNRAEILKAIGKLRTAVERKAF